MLDKADECLVNLPSWFLLFFLLFLYFLHGWERVFAFGCDQLTSILQIGEPVRLPQYIFTELDGGLLDFFKHLVDDFCILGEVD